MYYCTYCFGMFSVFEAIDTQDLFIEFQELFAESQEILTNSQELFGTVFKPPRLFVVYYCTYFSCSRTLRLRLPETMVSVFIYTYRCVYLWS